MNGRELRPIMTPGELDALPSGSVVLGADGAAWQKSLPAWGEGKHYWGSATASMWENRAPLPALLLLDGAA